MSFPGLHRLKFMIKGVYYWSALGFMLTLSGALASVNLNENLRQTLKKRFISDERAVLAKSMGRLLGDRRAFTVLKIKEGNDLILEVFENNFATDQTYFRSRTILPEHRDASFSYMGASVNLVLVDLNNDGVLNIVTAGFDENLIPRMHVYKYNDDTSSLESISPETFHF